MNKNVLVVGGGVTGMTSALELADQGFKVYLAEKTPRLGGVAAEDSGEPLRATRFSRLSTDLVEQTETHDNIEVITGAIIVDHTGMPGMFTTGMQVGRQMFYRQIEHGVTILATGALPQPARAFMLDECDQVVTQLEMQNLIDDSPEVVESWDNVVMIQCVGSRTEDNPNCSRICCQNAVKNALRIVDIRTRMPASLYSTGICGPMAFRRNIIRKPGKKALYSSAISMRNPPRMFSCRRQG